MSANTIDAQLLAKMFIAAANNLNDKKEWINELNVFPVPDGDTGTNMTMTIMSAAREVSSLISTNDVDMMTLCKAISSGSLRGARGNSGVILSQILRGFCKRVRDERELTIPIIAEATEKAVETAYKAVMKPKEGTILTVARGISEKACSLNKDGCEDMGLFISEIIKHGDEVLEKTPELLPVLKQAGVVDSGGQGLMQVLKGAYDAYTGKDERITLNEELNLKAQAGSALQAGAPVSVQGRSAATDGTHIRARFAEDSEQNIRFGYCTEFIIQLQKPLNIKAEMDFKAYLESIGDSIVCVADDEYVKAHVHTNDPGLALQRALKFGELSNIKIDNMRMEHREILFERELSGGVSGDDDFTMEHKDVAFVAVSVGDGLNEIFKSLGVDYIIEGGQTMNPSTQDMLNAIAKVNADTIYILPNNKNIVMAANQAMNMTEDKKVIVIPTKTVPQGISAVINYVPDLSPEDNAATMECEIRNVKTGQITYAVRDTIIDDREIKKGDYMGLGDHGILSVGQDENETALMMIREMMDDDKEIISIYYGIDVTEEEANELAEKVNELYPDCDVDLQYGGQPIYYYIVSAE